MSAKTIAGWAGAVIAVGGAVTMVLGPVQSSVRNLIAQEAETAAEMAVEKRMEPTAQKLESVVELLRTQQDFDMRQACELKRSEIRCKLESEYRWKMWGWEDCVQAKGANDRSCVKPEPLPEP